MVYLKHTKGRSGFKLSLRLDRGSQTHPGSHFLTNLFRRNQMNKKIIVEVRDGIVQSVYCPNESYEVHILDYDDNNSGDEVNQYYKDVESYRVKLVDCASI